MLDGMDQLRRDYEAHLHGNKDKTAEAKKRMREEEISFYSNSENEYGDDNIWGLLSGVAGNIYEW
jgi:membrane protein required for beta-lactamase induction